MSSRGKKPTESPQKKGVKNPKTGGEKGGGEFFVLPESWGGKTPDFQRAILNKEGGKKKKRGEKTRILVSNNEHNGDQASNHRNKLERKGAQGSKGEKGRHMKTKNKFHNPEGRGVQKTDGTDKKGRGKTSNTK